MPFKRDTHARRKQGGKGTSGPGMENTNKGVSLVRGVGQSNSNGDYRDLCTIISGTLKLGAIWLLFRNGVVARVMVAIL